jgi:hypothetical protein
MKAKAIVLVGILLVVTGCGGVGKKAKTAVTKTFYGRTIEYQMETSAKEDMSKLESLVGQAHEVDPPVPDKLLIPLYRDADVDRDHFITGEEAETYYRDYILQFEDSLGAVQYHSHKL